MLKTYHNHQNIIPKLLLVTLLLFVSTLLRAQDNSVAIGSPTVKDNAVLWLNGNGSQGLLLPSVLNVSDIPSPDEGMIVYQTSDDKIYYHNASAWVELGVGGGGSDQTLNYNSGTGELTISGSGGNTQTLSAGGDLTGNLGNITVTKLQGNPVDGTLLNNTTDANKVLQWDGSKWIAATLSGGGTDSQNLTFNSGIISLTGDPDNTQIDLSGYDTNVSDDFDGDYNSLSNQPSIPTNLNDLTNVNAPSPTTNQILQFNSGTGNWEPAPASGTGDMLEATYDTNSDNVVDDAEMLGGQLPALYLDNTDAQNAAAVPFDNATSGLTAIDVQAALDEIAADVQAGVGLPVMADAQIIVSNGSTPEAVGMTGDATIDNTGVVTIADNAITTGKIADDAVTLPKIANGTTSGEILKWNGSNWILQTGGNRWHDGAGIPSDGDGNLDGTYYLDQNTGDVYLKSAGTYTIVSNIKGDAGDKYSTTSSTANTISVGAKTFTVATGLAYSAGQTALIAIDGSNYMEGTVTSYSGSTLDVTITTITGIGSGSAWTINLNGAPGPAGTDGQDAFVYVGYATDSFGAGFNTTGTGDYISFVASNSALTPVVTDFATWNRYRVASSLPNGNILIGDAGAVPTAQPISGDISLTNAGVTTVTGIQGVTVSATTPTANQVLQYSAGQWAPATLATLGDMQAATYDPANIASDVFARANHTGTQLAATISDFNTAVSARIAIASVTNLSDVTDAGSGAIITAAERGQIGTNQTNITTNTTAIAADLDGSITNEIQTLSEVLTQGNSAGNAAIQSLANPTNPQDAATKDYVDTQLSGVPALPVMADAQIIISNGAVPTAADMTGDATIIADGTLTIAPDAIGSAEIADNTITTDDIANGTITGTDIASSTVAPSNIVGNTGMNNAVLGSSAAGVVTWQEGSPNQVLGTDGSGDLLFRDVIDSGTGIGTPGSEANLVTEAAVRAAIDAAAGGTLQDAYNGGGNIQMTPGGDINIRNTGASDFFHLIESTNSLGVGISSPSYTLDVRSMGVAANPHQVLRLLTAHPDSNVDLVGQGTGTGGLRIRSSGGSGDLIFQTGGINDRMTINSVGNVGIGTNAPTTDLHIESNNPVVTLKSTQTTSFAAPSIRFGKDNGSGGFTQLGTIGAPGSSEGFIVTATNMLSFNTNFTNRMIIDNTGNVGIGTSSPSQKLHINSGGVATALRLDNTVVGNNTLLAMYNNGTLASRLQATASSTNLISLGTTRDIDLYTNGASRLNIDGATGNVGIGTTAPEEALHIAQVDNTTDGTGGTFINVQNNSSTAPIGIISGIRFRLDGVGAGPNARYKGGILFQKTGSFGVGNIILATSAASDNTSITAADARMTITSTGEIAMGEMTVLSETNQLNLGIGINSVGSTNGITFWENTAFGMSLGYDGTSAGPGNKISIYNNLSTEIFRFENGGNAYKAGGGSWAALSDRRVKKDIRSYNKGLKELLQIKPVYFKYNIKSGYSNTNQVYVGVIAQEIKEVLPFTVKESGKLLDSSPILEYDGSSLTYLSIKAIQEQQTIIESQGVEIEILKEQLSAIKSAKATSSIESTSSDELQTLKAEIAEIKAMLGMKAKKE